MERSELLKVVWICRCLPTIDRERALRYWRTHHADMGRRVASMPLYLQNILTEAVGPAEPTPGLRPAVDGFSVCWFQGTEGFARNAGSQAMLEMDEDALTVFDRAAIWGGWAATLDETVTAHVPTPEDELFKVAWILRYRDGLDRSDARARWLGTHRALLDTVPGLVRHAQNHAVDPIGQDGIGAGPPLEFDAIAEFWFPDRPAWLQAAATPAWAAVLADAAEVFALHPAWAQGYAGVVDHLWINGRL